MTSPLVLGRCYMWGVAHWWSCIAVSVAVVVIVAASVGSVRGILPMFMA
jgi:hypothetical protein